MTCYQEWQACKDNTDHSQAIPLGSVRQTQNEKFWRRNSNTIWKPDRAKKYTYKEQLNNIPPGNSTSDTQKEGTQQNTRNNHTQRKITVNNGQRDIVNKMPLHIIIKVPNGKSDTHTQTRYGRIIRKPDKHIKSLECCMLYD